VAHPYRQTADSTPSTFTSLVRSCSTSHSDRCRLEYERVRPNASRCWPSVTGTRRTRLELCAVPLTSVLRLDETGCRRSMLMQSLDESWGNRVCARRPRKLHRPSDSIRKRRRRDLLGEPLLQVDIGHAARLPSSFLEEQLGEPLSEPLSAREREDSVARGSR
jgi:hypothetical protein